MSSRRNNAVALAVMVAVWTGLMCETRAQVRSMTVGVDVNCPPGLGECWRQGIGRGVGTMAGIASVAEEAEGESQTAQVWSASGKLIESKDLAAHIESLRFGARLRGMEATVDGWLEKRGREFVLSVDGIAQPLRLAPLTAKVQWDRRKARSFPKTSAEENAFRRVAAQWRGAREPVRIVGPVRGHVLDETTLEVREFYHFGTAPLDASKLTIGIRVNSPYGLIEPWGMLRETLSRFPAIVRVDERPDLNASTAQVWTRPGVTFSLAALNDHLRRAALGAEALGFETTVEGRLIRERDGLVLKISGTQAGSATVLPLAPLTRKVQVDYRQRREWMPSVVELSAHARLLKARENALVRVTGPLVQVSDRDASLLEVRHFELNSSPSFAQPNDASPPAPLRYVRAFITADGHMSLDWADSKDTDVAGYNVYRSSSAEGRLEKVNKEPIGVSEYILRAAGSMNDFYAVTVVDRAGNESEPSPRAEPAPPGAPQKLVVRAETNGIHLDWEDNIEPDFLTYDVRRSESPGGPYAQICVGLFNSTHLDTGATDGRTYYYVVNAVDASGNISAFSNEGSTLPKKP
jgi:hypothetical protein